MRTHTIDAENKKLGRVATEAAAILMGKDQTDFAKNVVTDVKVEILNVAKANISDKKKDEKIYVSYSGHPGGLKETPMKKVIEKKGYAEVFKKAVYGMLPSNKLRNERMKRLIINE